MSYCQGCADLQRQLATAQAETAALRADLAATAKLCEMALDGQNIRARFAALREKLSRPATEEGT